MTTARKRAILITLAVLLAIFLVVSAVTLVFVDINMREMFARAERPEYSTSLNYSDYEAGYPRSEISFYSGDNLLRGYLYGEGNTDGLVVISHGIGGGGDNYLAETLRFVNAGFEVIAFNNTGTYDSEGEGTMSLTQSYLDLDAALDFVENDGRFKDMPIYLYGHSWGGYAVSVVLREDHDITAAVSVSGYDNPLVMIREWTENSMGFLPAELLTPYIGVYNFFKYGTKSNLSASKVISSTDTPIMIVHGRGDMTISYGRASIISHQGEITNPYAIFITRDKLGQDDHNTLFMSQDAVTYMIRTNQERKELEAQYGSPLPNEVSSEFYANIDRERINRLDDDFMQTVINFFRSHQKEEDFLKQLLGDAI